MSKSPRKSSPARSRLDATREIHHRVKNNLQIIASILRLQMRRETSVAAQTALVGAVTRIMGMVQVHDLLAQGDARQVDLKDLLERLLDLNLQTFMMPGQSIRSRAGGTRAKVDADTALAVALAANELIVNALKHAFPGRREGKIEAEVRAGRDGFRVTITDDGAGLPQGFTLTGSSHLGLQLVRSAVQEDLGGEFNLTSGRGGTTAEIKFRPRAV